MDVAVVATSRGGTLTGGARSWDVVSPSEVAIGRHLFEQILYLTLPTAGKADGLVLDPTGTVISGVLGSYDYDARAVAGPALRAQVQATSGDHIVVTLPAPREVRRIHVRSTLISGSGNRLGLYRVDRTVRAEEPTVTASIGSNGVATYPVGFIDAHFAVGLNRSDGSGVRLGVSDIEEVTVRAYPTLPRLAFMNPDDPATQTAFWQFPGEIVGASSASARVDAGQAFTDAFQHYVDGLPAPFPASLEFALVIRSDAPCRVIITRFNVRYRLKRRSFPSGESKTAVRFPGDVATAREVTVELPSAATVRSARISIVESFSRDRPGALADLEGEAGGPDSLHGLILQMTGLTFGSRWWAAQSVVPRRATAVSGVLLGLLALESLTEVRVSLQDDWQGAPSGNALSSGSVTLERAGSRSWVAVHFPEAAVLPTYPHWLLLTTASGRAVWLIRDVPGQETRLLERTEDGPGLWYERARLEGKQGFYTFLSVRPTRGLSPGVDQTPSPVPVVLSVGAVVVPEAPPEGEARREGIRVFDLGNALALALAAAPGGEVSNLPLRLSSALAGLVTVYPPDIEYDM